MGLVGFALFLFIVGVLFYAFPTLGADLRLWVESMTANGPFLRPPEGVISAAIVFFLLAGVSNFATSALRFAVRRRRLKALSDAMGGVALVILSFLLTLYADRRVSGQLVIATWVAVLGGLLLIYIALGVYMHWARLVPKPGPESASRP